MNDIICMFFHVCYLTWLSTMIAYSWSIGTDSSNPLSTPIEGVQKDLAINTVSAYAAAQAAVESFDKLPCDVKKTFIYTGNTSNTAVSLSISFENAELLMINRLDCAYGSLARSYQV